jgi:salicylate hydroxylase
MFDANHHMSLLIQGVQWLREWGLDSLMMKPMAPHKLVVRDWETGRVLKQTDLGDREVAWGNVYHRRDMHKGLLHAATSEEGKGIPCKLVTDHT